MDTERRGSLRKRVLRRGRIVLRNGHSVIDCILVDLSDSGARLKTSGLIPLPERFTLRIDMGPTHVVEVRHRDLEHTGVRFVEAA
jgi:hypothetical protein